MKIIIGLGNPGQAYAQTRHNAGILFIDWLIKQKFKPKSSTSNDKYSLHIVREDLLVCRSNNFMNLSGKTVNSLHRKYPALTSKGLLVVHDDLEHKIGNFRIKEGGSAQGHNGIDSIIKQFHTNAFKRLQIGIARPESRDPQIVAKYVLSPFTNNELTKVKQNFNKAFQLMKQHQFL